MDEEFMNADSPLNPSLDFLNSAAFVRATQNVPQSKYAQLLAVIEEMGSCIKPAYSGSKSSAERLKRSIVHARILVRECLMETERSARQ